MNASLNARFSGLAFALVMTVATLLSIDSLATHESHAALLAQASATAQS